MKDRQNPNIKLNKSHFLNLWMELPFVISKVDNLRETSDKLQLMEIPQNILLVVILKMSRSSEKESLRNSNTLRSLKKLLRVNVI